LVDKTTITPGLARRHEALWLQLSGLSKTIAAIAAKKPDAPVGAVEQLAAEALLHECWPFLRGRIGRLPMAIPLYGGLAVQLGQALALMDDYENGKSYWDGQRQCRAWRTGGAFLPIGRLRQEVAGQSMVTYKGENVRVALAKRLEAKWGELYESGFRAGRAARIGPPEVITPRGPRKSSPRYDDED
jgi:hypothetical protein